MLTYNDNVGKFKRKINVAAGIIGTLIVKAEN